MLIEKAATVRLDPIYTLCRSITFYPIARNDRGDQCQRLRELRPRIIANYTRCALARSCGFTRDLKGMRRRIFCQRYPSSVLRDRGNLTVSFTAFTQRIRLARGQIHMKIDHSLANARMSCNYRETRSKRVPPRDFRVIFE